DPGPEGALFQTCIDKYAPRWLNSLFIRKFPNSFPATGADGKPVDQISILLDMYFNPSLVPKGVSIRDFGQAGAVGEGKYWLDRHLRARGDQNIKSIADLINKAKFAQAVADTRFIDAKVGLEGRDRAMTFDLRERMLQMFAIQQIVLQCMAEQHLDA